MTAEVKVEEKQVETEVAVTPQEETVKVVEEEVKSVEEDVKTTVESETKPESVEKTDSFKEESNFLSDLKESERKALIDLKSKLEEAIVGNTLFETKKKESPVKEKKEEAKKEAEEESKPEEKAEAEKKETVAAEEEKKTDEKDEDEKKDDVAVEEEKKTEAIVTEEEKKTEAVVTEEEEKKAEEDVTEDSTKEEVKHETVEEKEKKSVEEEEEEKVDQEISLWGVPLLPSKGTETTDVILLKFLRARDFKVNEAFEMLKTTLLWRKQNNIDSILEEEFDEELDSSAAFMNGVDREGHPVCYNTYSVFENDELYKKTFGTEEKREKFLRWRFQLMEKGIQKLNLKPGGVTSLLQIHDLKNSPGLTRKELLITVKHAIESLQDNYPEFVSRNIFINVPFWFYALNALLSPFLTHRTKSKFVVARPAKVAETLLKYIPVEEIPTQYGGFKRDGGDLDFSGEHAISEIFVKPGSSETIEIPAPEVGATAVWEITVLGWEVSYKEEFVPEDEGSYTVIVQKGKKIGSNEGPIRNSFRNNEAGKIVLTVDNISGKKKKRVLYRFNTKTGSSF